MGDWDLIVRATRRSRAADPAGDRLLLLHRRRGPAHRAQRADPGATAPGSSSAPARPGIAHRQDCASRDGASGRGGTVGGGAAKPVFGVVPRPSAPTAEDLDLMPEAGISGIRLIAPWTSIESDRGSYDWRGLDAVVRETTGRGIQPLLVFYGTPEWAAHQDGHSCIGAACATFPPWSEATRAAFAAFVGAAAERYGPGGDFWPAPVSTTVEVGDSGEPAPPPVAAWTRPCPRPLGYPTPARRQSFTAQPPCPWPGPASRSRPGRLKRAELSRVQRAPRERAPLCADVAGRQRGDQGRGSRR